MAWHISWAEYHKDQNAITEHRLGNFEDYSQAKEAFDLLQLMPIVLWADECVDLDDPYFAMIETDAYRNEYKKIKD